jgi:molybdenum cofactor biosynthesis protein B
VFAPTPASVKVGIITASDSRSADTNHGGQLVKTLAEAAGFSVIMESLLREDPGVIQARVRELVDSRTIDVLLITGGTGLSPRDRTVEAVGALLDQRIDGYGELFRMLSFSEIGAAAMLSRAMAGVIGRVPVFLMPGSPAGVRLAMERLILPELTHLVSEVRRHGHGERHGHPGA